MDQRQFDNLLDALWDGTDETCIGESLAQINGHLELLCLMKFADLDFPGARKALFREYEENFKGRFVD